MFELKKIYAPLSVMMVCVPLAAFVAFMGHGITSRSPTEPLPIVLEKTGEFIATVRQSMDDPEAEWHPLVYRPPASQDNGGAVELTLKRPLQPTIKVKFIRGSHSPRQDVAEIAIGDKKMFFYDRKCTRGEGIWISCEALNPIDSLNLWLKLYDFAEAHGLSN